MNQLVLIFAVGMKIYNLNDIRFQTSAFIKILYLVKVQTSFLYYGVIITQGKY